MRYLCAALIAALAGVGEVAWAYEETIVSEGGTLVGTVTLEGKVPQPKGYNLTTLPDQYYCGRISDGQGWRILQPFQVGPAGEFRDVVVYLEGIDKGKPFVEKSVPKIEAKDCLFLPFTTVVRDDQTVTVVNMDPVMHDIQAYETSHLGPRVLFNVPLPMNPHTRETSKIAATPGCTTNTWPAADEAIGQSQQGPPGFRHAMRLPCVHGELGTGDGESLLCADRPGWEV